MTTDPEDSMFMLAPGVLQDVQALAREMVATGQPSRLYPDNDTPMFGIATDRDLMSMVIGQINVDETTVYIGRLLSTNDAPGVSPNNG